MVITCLSGSEPHPDYNGWAGFLETCEVRDRFKGVVFYGRTNCNYILFPCGTLICNFGYHGKALMQRIREEGKTRVLQDLRFLARASFTG